VSIKDHMSCIVHVLSVLAGMHVRADGSGRHMVVVTHGDMLVLLEGFEGLSGGNLVGKGLVTGAHRHVHVHELLVLLEIDRVHGCLLWVLAKAQPAHGGVKT
jgi:hypothetical protein